MNWNPLPLHIFFLLIIYIIIWQAFMCNKFPFHFILFNISTPQCKTGITDILIKMCLLYIQMHIIICTFNMSIFMSVSFQDLLIYWLKKMKDPYKFCTHFLHKTGISAAWPFPGKTGISALSAFPAFVHIVNDNKSTHHHPSHIVVIDNLPMKRVNAGVGTWQCNLPVCIATIFPYYFLKVTNLIEMHWGYQT